MGHSAWSALVEVVSAVTKYLKERNDRHGRNPLLATYITYQVIIINYMQTSRQHLTLFLLPGAPAPPGPGHLAVHHPAAPRPVRGRRDQQHHGQVTPPVLSQHCVTVILSYCREGPMYQYDSIPSNTRLQSVRPSHIWYPPNCKDILLSIRIVSLTRFSNIAPELMLSLGQV